MDNYIGYGLILAVATGGIYLNRWSILERAAPLIDRGLDHFFEFKRSICGKGQVYLDNRQLIVTEISIRRFDSEEDMRLIEKTQHVVDIHLGDDGTLDLSLCPKKCCQICQKPDWFSLIDIYYHFHGHKFLFTCPSGPSLISLYRPRETHASFSVAFETVSIRHADGSICSLSETLQHCLVDQINRYLGPLNDFHYGLNPVKTEWMDLKDLPFHKGDTLILTTQLMETVELEWGSILQNSF